MVVVPVNEGAGMMGRQVRVYDEKGKKRSRGSYQQDRMVVSEIAYR